MDRKYWNLKVWTELCVAEVDSSEHWCVIRTYRFQWRVLLNNVTYLQVPVAGPSEQCCVLTGSSGGSF